MNNILEIIGKDFDTTPFRVNLPKPKLNKTWNFGIINIYFNSLTTKQVKNKSGNFYNHVEFSSMTNGSSIKYSRFIQNMDDEYIKKVTHQKMKCKGLYEVTVKSNFTDKIEIDTYYVRADSYFKAHYVTPFVKDRSVWTNIINVVEKLKPVK